MPPPVVAAPPPTAPSGVTASVHSWELATAVDGPGTRLTVFLSGCPLRCRYCHNPDTWRFEDGTPTPVGDLVELVRRYRPVFTATGGGVTLSGGEPLRQPDVVRELFTACRRMGVRTALDTSGFLGADADDELLDVTDLVLLDVKSGLADTYRAVTGGELAPTVAFGDRLAARGDRMWIRFVLVPGLTDADENVDAVGRIVARWPTVDRVEVLPFHQLGEHKWDALGIPYSLHGVRPPDAETQDRVRARLRSHGLLVL
nr:pyruvate formate-lyase-activating protein [Amnibacterium kyonggiense]